MQPTSKHFQIEPLTDGVYAAIAKDGELAISNAGIIDLGDRVLLFDTFASPQAARDLVATAEKLTGHPVRAAVNSHWHFDHVTGNQSLPAEAVVISTPATRDLVAERIPTLITNRREGIPRQLHDLEAQLQAEPDPEKREKIGKSIDFFRMAMVDLSNVSVRLPDQTFDQRITLHGPSRSVEFISVGCGHTPGDAILYLPAEQIAFVADLLFKDIHPYIGECSPEEWLGVYDAIEALSPAVEVVVPGHGTVSTPDDFAALRRYIPALRQIAADVIKQGGSIEDAAARPVPAAFSEWRGADRFPVNMRYIYTHATG